jgi:hypothetical protein
MGRSGRGEAAAEGELVELDLEKVVKREEELDTSVTFEIELPKRVYIFEQKVVVPETPPKPKKEGDDEDPDAADEPPPPPPPPPPAGRPLVCAYATNSTFFVGYDGPETSGAIFECTFDFKFPLKELRTHARPVCFLAVWPPWHSLADGPSYLLSGARDGRQAYCL